MPVAMQQPNQRLHLTRAAIVELALDSEKERAHRRAGETLIR
jgi:hypothetical protein